MGIQKRERQTRGQHFAGTLFAFSVQKQSFAALYRALRRHQRVREQKECTAPTYHRHQSREPRDKGLHTGRPRTDADNIPKNATEDTSRTWLPFKPCLNTKAFCAPIAIISPAPVKNPARAL